MRRLPRLLATATLPLLIQMPVADAAPGEPAGATIKVVNLVTAEYERDTRTLATGDDVRQEDLIAVGNNAIGEIKLLDDTKLALGAGARLRLDKFVYDPGKAQGAVVLDLVKGAFRFMTGAAEKPAYVVKTPSAAITVRGTIFDVFIDQSGLTWVLLHEGGLTVCNTRGKCRDLDEPGRLLRVTEDGSVGIPVRWSGLPGHDSVPFDTAFPFVVAPPSIDPTPHFTRDAILEDGNDEPAEPKKPYREPKPDKPRETKKTDKTDDTPKKKGGTVVVTKPESEPKPKKRTTSTDDGVKVINGMDVVIGIGGGIGFGGKHRGSEGHDYPKPGPLRSPNYDK